MRTLQSALFAAALVLAHPALGGPPPGKDAAGGAPKAKRTDPQGDPLPEGALARFGSNRWQHPAQQLAFSPDGRYLAATGQVTRLFDVKSGRAVRRFNSPGNFLFFPADGKT